MYLFLQHVTFWLRACHLFSFSSCDAPSWAPSLSAAGSADHVFKKLYSPIKCLHFVYFLWFCQHIYIFQMVLEVNSAISKCCVGQHTLHHCKLWLCFLNCSYLNWRRCSCPRCRKCWCVSIIFSIYLVSSANCFCGFERSFAAQHEFVMVKAGERFVDQTNTCAFRRTH